MIVYEVASFILYKILCYVAHIITTEMKSAKVGTNYVNAHMQKPSTGPSRILGLNDALRGKC